MTKPPEPDATTGAAPVAPADAHHAGDPAVAPAAASASDVRPAAPAAASRTPGPTDSTVCGGLPAIADGLVRHLDPRAVTLARTHGAISAAIVSVMLLIPVATTTAALGVRSRTPLVPALAWLAVTLLLAWWSHYWPAVLHRHVSYRIDAQGIEIRRGVIWRTVVNVPRSRVQHTDVAQGPLERKYGLGRLVVYTAGSAHAMVSLDGLAHATALGIRDYLLPGEGSDAV